MKFKSEKEIVEYLLKDDNLSRLVRGKLFIIGHQVEFEKTKEIIDILAIDKKGDIVVIEAKHKMSTSAISADFQGARYSNNVSDWSILDIKKQTEKYYYNKKNSKINFDKKIHDFLNVSFAYLNAKQRIIIIGTGINRNLNKACDWFFKQGVDISVFKLCLNTQENEKDVSSKKLVPKEPLQKNGPLIEDQYGEKYHLDRCDHKIIKLCKVLNETLNELYDIKGPDWSKKTYVSFLKDGKRVINYRVNRSSIYLKRSHRFTNPVDLKMVKEKLIDRLDFPVEDKINF